MRNHNIRKKLKKHMKQSRKFFLLKMLYPFVYKISTLKPLKENQIIFVENSSNTLSNNFSFLYTRLVKDYSFDIDIHFLNVHSSNRWEYLLRCIRLVSASATSKYVFLSDAINIFGCISLRKGSVFTQLWHGCGAFKKFGFSTSELLFGDSRRELEKYPNYTYNTYMTVSSPEVIWAYQEATGLPAKKIVPTGISRTDLLYDPQFISNAYEHFFSLMPEASGKKIVLYAPTFRGKTTEAKAPEALSIPIAFQELSDTHVLIIKHHPLVKKRPPVLPEFRTFARDLTDDMDIEELLCVADICITDYSSLIYEYSLFEKPIVFFAYDFDEYCDWRGFFYNYKELVPGPVFYTTEEVIDYVKYAEERFNRKQIKEFKEMFMSSCDGYSTQRILQLVFQDNLSRFKKRDNEKGKQRL